MKTVIVVSADNLFIKTIQQILSRSFRVLSFGGVNAALEFIYNEVPDIIIADVISAEQPIIEGLNGLKGDPLFSRIPVLAVFRDQSFIRDWEDFLVEDYLLRDDLERDLLPRVNLANVRSSRVVEINPLTRLPGNICINREIQQRLDKNEIFALAYADISEFKPFNDRYGFSRGDEVIKITGRLILNIVRSKQPEGSFIGHIGGDDFVFIMERNLMPEACTDIIHAFDSIVPTLYDPADRQNNGIESVDRRGNRMFFPFVALAVGVTDTANRHFSHFGELTEVVSEMKSLAKKQKGSAFCLDRRIIRPSR